MGFFDSLRRILGDAPDRAPASHSGTGIAGSWSPDEAGSGADDGDPAVNSPEPFRGGEYDRKNWRRKLKTLLDELPASQEKWADHVADAQAMGFDPAEVSAWSREEFTLLVRKVVADRVVTESEHRTLDLARDLLTIPDAEAEQILQAVASEAEKFFGGTVKEA